jgi:hypothetical protein
MKEKNPLLFPLLMAVMIALMYMFAFHEKREECKVLQNKIEQYEKTH